MPEENNPSQSPFRQRALEYVSTPKSLDDLVQVTSPLSWLTLLAFWIALAMVIIWMFFGTVATHISGKGILVNNIDAIVTVSALDSHRVKTGMSVKINPSRTEQWEFGSLSGQVTDVDYVPATPEAMLQLFKNQSLVDYFLKSGPVIILHVHLNKSVSLPSGALIDARVTISRQTPMSLWIGR